MGCSCCGDDSTHLIYACSGASNTGELTDRVMRTVNRASIAKSSCLAALGSGLSGFRLSAENADRLTVLDGCGTACGKKIAESLGLEVNSFIMTDMGIEKGKTIIDDETVTRVSRDVITALREKNCG